MNKLSEIIENILKNRGSALQAELSDSTDLRRDMGFDSFDLAELSVRLEDAFGKDVFADGPVSKVGEILERLK
ncbi:MAG: acyl carrier protein [Opitutales bacterium]|nr:acyl carrier protein [Opitutales bacterium]